MDELPIPSRGAVNAVCDHFARTRLVLADEKTSMIATLLGTGLPWLLVALGCWFVYQLLRQNGRILLRLEALEE